MDKRSALDELFATGRMQLRRGQTFTSPPKQFRNTVDFDRIDGMMLGLAIGDGLGNTSEGKPTDVRRERHGEIRDYLPNHGVGGRTVGLPTDDTQLAFWTLEQILEDGNFDPESLAAKFCSRRIFGIGKTVKEFSYNYRSGKPWQECAPISAGNGALMRIAPILIPHLISGDENLWVDTALCARLTHNDSASIASCIAFVKILWELLDMDRPPSAEWWLDSFVDTLEDLECRADYEPRFGEFVGSKGSLAWFCKDKIGEARKKGLSTVDACNAWGSGAYLLETVPSVIYILMNHGQDMEEAIVRAVNDTRDNDTVAAIVGAAVGALHGKKSIPTRWLENLPGYTNFTDEGRVQELLSITRSNFESAN